ncbi:MAG: cysteine desulfurase [Planctomycetes bacterium]|nr:cysteine desulfurase [Planctomycetota bacterium]
MRMIYLDNAATTRLRPEVMEAMAGAAEGNPSSIHAAGRAARKQIEDARERIAQIVSVDPKEIVFTSGATEANNLAIFGTVGRGEHVVTTAVEHPSVLEACAALEGCETTRVGVDGEGRVDPSDVERAITPRTSLISVMLGNNEVGTIQPVEAIEQIARARRIAFHVDAAQACGKVRLRRVGDLMTLSAHKMHGPKAVGALVVRRGTRLRARQFGGGQEFERRAGTENVAGIVGFAKAVELAQQGGPFERLRERLRAGLSRIPGVRFNGSVRHALPHIVNVSFRGVDGEAVVMALDAEGVCVSSGSACASQSLRPSHVLEAMGLRPEEARASVRFSLGVDSTEEEVDGALAAVARVVERLRRISPVA